VASEVLEGILTDYMESKSMAIARPKELAAVAVLSVCWALALIDITGIDYLMPFIAPNLKLNNTQIGLLFSLYYIPFGVSSYVTGELTDRFGKRRTLLVSVMLLFSLASVLPGLATSFTTLLMTRLLMGLLAGPILPLAQTIVAMEMPAERRGTNMGIVQNVGSSVFGFFTPVLLVALAVHWGWRSGFFVIAIPGLVCTALVALSLHRVPDPQVSFAADGGDGARRRRKPIREVLRHRNIWLCIVGACLFTSFILIGRGYLPLFYVQLRHLTPQRMGLLMSVLSVSGLILGVVFPALADRFGRKPAAILSSLLGAILPLAALYFAGPDTVLGLLMFIGWAPAGASILLFATIPSETVPAHSTSTAIGLTFAIGTLIGGFLGPAVAGWSADRWGLQSSLLLEAGCAVAMAIICLGLRETRPVKRT
jgi:ACS family hexuronate transporter-like MFS transporter